VLAVAGDARGGGICRGVDWTGGVAPLILPVSFGVAVDLTDCPPELVPGEDAAVLAPVAGFVGPLFGGEDEPKLPRGFEVDGAPVDVSAVPEPDAPVVEEMDAPGGALGAEPAGECCGPGDGEFCVACSSAVFIESNMGVDG